MNQNIFNMPYKLIIQITIDYYWHLVVGLLVAFFSYFSDMKEAFHLLFIAFILDIIIGIWAAKAVKKINFNTEKFFTALKRMAITYILIMLLYANDKILDQNTIDTSGIMSWLVTGFLAYSIAENGYLITGGLLFLKIKSQLRNKIKSTYGIDIDKDENIKQAP